MNNCLGPLLLNQHLLNLSLVWLITEGIDLGSLISIQQQHTLSFLKEALTSSCSVKVIYYFFAGVRIHVDLLSSPMFHYTTLVLANLIRISLEHSIGRILVLNYLTL